MPVHLARALTREQAYSSYKFSAASEPITFPYAPAKRRVKIHKEAMAGSLEQLNLHLPVRHSRFARPRRRGDMELDLRVRVEASLTSRPPKTGVFGSISSFLPMTDVFAGAAARAASQSTIHPLDTIKVRMQATLKDKRSLRGKNATNATAAVSTGKYGIGIGQATHNARSSPRSVAIATGALLGKLGAELGSLYKGVLGAAGGAGIAIGTYFAFYGAAKKFLEAHSDCSVSTIAFLAGGIGALGSSIVKVPAAVCIRSVQANVYPNVVVAARQITSAAGPRGLFTGYLPTLLEDVPDMAVKFAAYETMRTMHRRLTGRSQEEAAAVADISMGLIAGAVAAAATTPLDVVKTRMMCNASQQPSFTGAISSVWHESVPGFGRVRTFFTGVGPRSFSNGINSAIFFCFFEIMRSSLRKWEDNRKTLPTGVLVENYHGSAR
ncbi:hypothetical protein CBD41_05310 [bacterium TMED181]|nr:hypothetical protein [Planctomycetota bacterium]OUW44671.1 MAG: hypothetical protein CBD41_05310 [bacterium TMED181]